MIISLAETVLSATIQVAIFFGSPGFGAAAVGGAVIGVGLWWYRRHRRQQQRLALDRLLTRSPALEYTVIPLGLRSDQLAWWCRGLPDGDRENGVRYGVEGPMTIDLGPSMSDTFTVAAFEWSWEEERQDRSRGGTGFRRSGFRTGRSVVERRVPAALVRLPVTVDSRVMLEPESLLGRIGITRGGHQFESAEFNRRFRVEAMNPGLALSLVDAGFQHLMVEDFPHYTVELFGDLLLVAGTPDHRDTSLTGVVGLLPALRQDTARILRAVPAAYWRTVGATKEPR